jgi:endoglucanase
VSKENRKSFIVLGITLLFIIIISMKLKTEYVQLATTQEAGQNLYVPFNQPQAWLGHFKVGDFDSDLKRSYTQADFDAIKKIANQPTAIWINTPDDIKRAALDSSMAASKKEIAVFVLYAIPGRDNGNYSSGGLQGPKEYHEFVARFAEAITECDSRVILEPDAIGLAPALNEAKRNERYAMLRDAVETLNGHVRCQVFMEISQWLSESAAVEAFYLAGGKDTQGFAVNTSGYEFTKNCIEFAKGISGRIGNKPCLIDTSRNGKGPYKPSDPNEKDPWCNPPDRAIGDIPTFDTKHPVVAAKLWIKVPGESDGTCRGGPPAGVFWPARAIELVNNSKK